ncbi:hypothetical protein J2X47_002012 [Sphingomonas sp. BE270]|jgi:hypothetical protein|uniref:hypothetical protein n=1 Tax=Sphingomonas sp. BE270 TaxID=2817726 RepID=UPI002865FD28|nr:hypothetical protein [Sphingomonas sp. BE270]MDR7257832.1 hypothetical protein [Sphingomonas sp. BE270]
MSALPPGEYAIVEVLGHRTIIGRVEEVERFGAKLMSIEAVFNGELLDAVMIGGSSIYQFTPCSAEVAEARQPKEDWQLPPSIRAVLPVAALPAPAFDPPAFMGEAVKPPPCASCGGPEPFGECECIPF